MAGNAASVDRRLHIAVDLDGTLAEYHGWQGPDRIGAPIMPMVRRVRRVLAEGHRVTVLTARLSDPDQAESAKRAIEGWCKRNIGVVLPVTAVKGFQFDELWDDRAVGIEANTGRPLSASPRGHDFLREVEEVEANTLAWWAIEQRALDPPKPEPDMDRATEAEVAASATKPTNPKDALAVKKAPLHLWPASATAWGSLALYHGAGLYGRNNWRVAPVLASVYVGALLRHVAAWFEGERCAPDSQVHHLGHALACIAILVDAEAKGTLIDDRNVEGHYQAVLAEVTALLPHLQALHAGHAPQHYTIADSTADSGADVMGAVPG